MPAVGPGGGGAGGGRLHQAFEGIFTATTVVQRAFKAGSLIGLQGSSGAPVGYLAPVDIPVNSPAPGARNSLWVSFGGSFGGVDRATFDAALARKANAASLANYLQTSTYNIEKARLESGITGNDNDITALQEAINNLPSEVGDVTTAELEQAVAMLEQQIGNVSGPLFVYELWARSKTTVLAAGVTQGTPADLDWMLEDDVPDALAVDGDFFLMPQFYRGHVTLEVWQGDTLEDRLILEVQSQQTDGGIGDFNVGGNAFSGWSWLIDQRVVNNENVNRIYVVPSNPASTMLAGLEFRIYAEVALSRSDVSVQLDGITERVRVAETNIDQLETQVENIPLTSDVLWATSGTLPTTLARGTVLATAWTASSDLPAGVAVDGNFLNIPEALRGELHIDVFNTANEMIGRVVIDIHEGAEIAFTDILPDNRISAEIIEHPSDNTLLRLQIRNTHARNGSTIVSGTTMRVYGVSALPRSQVDGVTQEQLKSAIDGINDFYIDPNRRYATVEDLRKNWVFFFSNVPEEYANANLVSVSWDGVLAYRSAWTPATRYILFSIDPRQINNLIDNANADTSKLTWRVQVTFLRNTEALGIEDVPIIIDRG